MLSSFPASLPLSTATCSHPDSVNVSCERHRSHATMPIHLMMLILVCAHTEGVNVAFGAASAWRYCLGHFDVAGSLMLTLQCRWANVSITWMSITMLVLSVFSFDCGAICCYDTKFCMYKLNCTNNYIFEFIYNDTHISECFMSMVISFLSYVDLPLQRT